jgi:putative N-acetylmannosamine-6-phosphate epimerase
MIRRNERRETRILAPGRFHRPSAVARAWDVGSLPVLISVYYL